MKKLFTVFSLLSFMLISCGNISEDIIINVSTKTSMNRQAEVTYYDESDCDKYFISVFNENGLQVVSNYISSNEAISFHLYNEGIYDVEVTAYNKENIEIGKGKETYVLNYGDVVGLIIRIKPNINGVDVSLTNGIDIVWENPDSEFEWKDDYDYVEKIKEIDDDIIDKKIMRKSFKSEDPYYIGEVIYDSENNPIGVVAGKLNDYWFALGLYESETMSWQSEEIESRCRIPTIQAHLPNAQDESFFYHFDEYEDDYDGSDNFEEVLKFYDFDDSYKDYFYALFYAESYDDIDESVMNSKWYLPTLWEYKTMFENEFIINDSLISIKGQMLNGVYWSSTQDSKRIEADMGDFKFGGIDSDQSSNRIYERSKARAIFKLK